MKVIGFRCSTNSITYSVITGKISNPKVQKCRIIKLPRGYKRKDELKWIFQETNDLIKKEKPKLICIKDTEPMARKGNNYVKRLENETVIILACSLLNVSNCYKKVKSTIAKDLGLKGKGKYLETKLDCSVINSYEQFDKNEKESILCAWSLLK